MPTATTHRQESVTEAWNSQRGLRTEWMSRCSLQPGAGLSWIVDHGYWERDAGYWRLDTTTETRDWTSIGSAVGAHLARWPLGASSGSFDSDSWAILGGSFCTSTWLLESVGVWLR